MGTFVTCYGDAGFAHEGYAGQVLDDGTLTATYSRETEARMVGQVVAACDCGWTGTTRYPCPKPFDEQAHDLALDEWEHDHARPTLARTQRFDLSRLQRLLHDLTAGIALTETTAPRALAEQLQRALHRLAGATQLAEQLHEQAQAQHDPTHRED